MVVPAYNRVDALTCVLECLERQTVLPSRTIVVDDASEPPLRNSISRTYPDLNIEWLRLDKNRGPGTAREAGRSRVDKAHVLYVDSDDKLREDAIQRLLGVLIDQPNLGMVYSTAEEVTDLGSLGVRRRSSEGFDAILPAVLFGRPWPTSGCMWRTSCDVLGAPWEALYAWEDYVHDVRVGCHDVAIAHLPEPLCRVGVSVPGRVSQGSGKKHLRRKAVSMLQAYVLISRALRCSRWVEIDVVQWRLRTLAWSMGVIGLDAGLFGRTHRMLREAIHWQLGQRGRWHLRLVMVTTFLRQKGAGMRLARYLRRREGAMPEGLRQRATIT